MGGDPRGQEEGREEGLLTFAELLEMVFDERRTGQLIVHFKDGRPQVAEIPRAPRRIRIRAH